MNKAFAAWVVGAVAIGAVLLLARPGESAAPVASVVPARVEAAGSAKPTAASSVATVAPPASAASMPAYAGGPVDIRSTTAKAVVDFALQQGVEGQLLSKNVLIHCFSVGGMNAPFVYGGNTSPPFSASMSEQRKQRLALYEKFCSDSYKVERLRAIVASIDASPDYAKDIQRMWSDKPWTLAQAQAAIQALADPAAHPMAVHSFVTRAVRNDQMNSLAGRVFAYRELTGDHDPYSAINAFLCLNNSVCQTNAELAAQHPEFIAEARLFLQRVQRQDWRALGLQ